MSARSPQPHPSLSRRSFLAATGLGAAALAAPRSLLAAGATPARNAAFNTANLVARVTGHRYELGHWMDRRRSRSQPGKNVPVEHVPVASAG